MIGGDADGGFWGGEGRGVQVFIVECTLVLSKGFLEFSMLCIYNSFLLEWIPRR